MYHRILYGGDRAGAASRTEKPCRLQDRRRSRRLLACGIAGGLLLVGCGEPQPVEPRTAEHDAARVELTTVDQQVSYGIGRNIGAGIARQGGLEVDTAAFTAGLSDGLSGTVPRLDDATLEAAFMALEERAEASMGGVADKNLTAAQVFLDGNRVRPSVITTESGLQYEILESGDGTSPGSDDTVQVHYHGTLIDGTVFDSSVDRGAPITFPVMGVIPGWVEALQLMSVGDKWRLFIPPGLGYGPRAAGPIPPNSVLIFEVELLGIQ